MAIDISRFIPRFVQEARGQIQQLEEGLTALESAADEKETIKQLFRSAHTIKGSSRILSLSAVGTTAHQLEELLGAVQKEVIVYSPELGNLLYDAVDELSRLVELVESGQTSPATHAELIERLSQAAQGKWLENEEKQANQPEKQAVPESNSSVPSAPQKSSTNSDLRSKEAAHHQPEADKVTLKPQTTVRINQIKLDDLTKLMGEVVSSHALIQQRLLDLRQLTQSIDEHTSNMEIAEQLKQFRQQMREDVMQQQLLVEELHDTTLDMRMLPLSTVFEPAARMVRELARTVDKKVECQMRGGEIELDRQIIDKLNDPLVHLLRNALDHGVESPQQRLSAGKSKYAQIQLQANQEGHWVSLTLSDDGGGLNQEQIRQKAMLAGLYSEQELNTFNDKELYDLIFLPGLSTKERVTEISGRGVGMDVVKKTIVEDLQGEISVESSTQGTRFYLKIPFSLAMMRILLCRSGEQLFAFTATSVDTLLSIRQEQIMPVAERLAIKVENEFVPLLDLAEWLNVTIDPSQAGFKMRAKQTDCLVVVVKSHQEKLAFIIDDLIDERDMVIKALPTHMQTLPFLNGMVLTGKNELVCVLNVPHLIQSSTSRMASTKWEDKRLQHNPDENGELGWQGGRPNQGISGAHILVVDDSLNTREIEKDVLESFGYRVTTAEDGIDAWNKAHLEDYDAILTDIEMPGMDGFVLTQRLRQVDKFRHIPIIIVTSREKTQDKHRGIEVGADAYIVKGDFEQSNLLETLQNLLV